ncbi:DUF4339 domain-containing protein [Luteolibacter yonseiensis]|uniref:DUF4339 domain-containing protein n=1 Tax=Luteolibacter yonseiensis TaxID=1144680 RepID=A0A934VB28_9BACT|nr:GYF domain-containing protein [Luteolibacter yonseiensis]MBK1815496.1 DUF4339 domain-containing protein [Luteolibacter yonseiensis]
MSDWYYAKDGKQNGPVSRGHLAELLQNGTLDPAKDLVWTSTMRDWLPAAQVPEFSTRTADPYSTPASSWIPPVPGEAGVALDEIPPGSDPINVMACAKRGLDLTVRNFGMILLIGIIYFAITMAVGSVLGAVDVAMGWGETTHQVYDGSSGFTSNYYYQTGSPLNFLGNQVLAIFLSLGFTRITLNLVSGREFSIGMLFGEGQKLLPAIGATILYSLMVGLGLLLFIVPGIYLALRFGFYRAAIVDRNLGVLESLRYSSSLTTNNRLSLFVLSLLTIFIILAGMLALCVGLLFAIPVASLAWVVAYRWLQYGHRAAEDHPGTQTPVLSTGNRGV